MHALHEIQFKVAQIHVDKFMLYKDLHIFYATSSRMVGGLPSHDRHAGKRAAAP